ncbi:MAG: DUF4129 domain-containing protein [Flavobacteriaceae bacterium]|nr:DUF4129 domain-containing protein [Flavobacteriaceae bacterium]
MNRLLHILFYACITCFSVIGQEQENQLIVIDSSIISEKSFNEDLASKYTAEDFNYETSVEGEAQNFIARAIQWFFQKISEFFGVNIDPAVYEIIEFVVYAILIGLALYLIVRLLVGNNASAFFRKKSAHLAPLNVQVDHIENVDLEKLIRDALKQKNYRLAIRYMYLKALKELSSKNLISWHYDKTNADYQREIENIELRSKFQKVSYLYDYVWYGEFEIDAEGFASAQRNFDLFTQNLKNAG